MSESNNSHVIRQLPHVVCRSGLILLDGTLVLTNQELKLINAKPIRERIDASSLAVEETTKEEEEEGSKKKSSNIKENLPREDLTAISIPLESIESMTFETALGQPSLSIKWIDNRKSFGRTSKSQFIQRGRGENKEQRIVSWIPIIDETKNARVASPEQGEGTSEIEKEVEEEENTQDSKRLETEIVSVLHQKEWKGPFQIASELRDRYNSKYDFDRVEALCKQLAKRKLIEEDEPGEFFRKIKST